MKHALNSLLLVFCIAFSTEIFGQYQVVSPSGDMKNLISLRRIGDNYYARRTGVKYTYLTFDKNFKTVKSAPDRQVDDSKEFRLGNNMYVLTVVEDKKKQTLDFFYATYQEPTKTTLLKSYNLKIYNETKFFDAYKEKFTGTEMVNTVSNLNFYTLYKVANTADYQHLLFAWLNPDSVYTLNYEVTVYDKDFKEIKQHKVLTEGTFSFNKGEDLTADHRGNVYMFKHTPGFDELDFARYNFKTGETVSKRLAIDRVPGHEEMIYKIADIDVDTLSGETCVLFFLPHSQSTFSLGTSGANTSIGVGYVNVYDRNGNLIKRNDIKLSKADCDSLKLPDDDGQKMTLSMAYPYKGGIYRYSNGNYAIHLEFYNYKTAPLSASDGIMAQTQPNSASAYYYHSDNNFLVRVFSNTHDQLKDYNIYRRRLRGYTGLAVAGNDEYWFFSYPPLSEYNPRESVKGILYACYLDKNGEKHPFKMEGGKFVQVDPSLRINNSDPINGLPLLDDDTHLTVILQKK